MRFALLGPVEVHVDDGPVEIRGVLRRTLLAALLLQHGSVVSADRLCELVWGEHPPTSVTTALYNQIMRLRQALGEEAHRIRAVAPGYLIHVEPGELDLDEFRDLCGQARRAAAEADWPTASAHYAAAVGLWRGEMLVDVPALHDQVALHRFEEDRLLALHGRIEADLHLGQHEKLVGELRTMTGHHPLHEGFHGQLMLALYRSGRQAEALGAYRDLRKAVVAELGVEPGQAIQEMQRRILNSDPALDPPRQVPEVETPPAARQLPSDTRLFTGRSAELAGLTRLAEAAAEDSGAGLVVISAINGTGGIGKTALAVHAAHRVHDRFPDGQLFIDLQGYSPHASAVSPQDALDHLLRSLGVPPQSVPSDLGARAALYRSRLAGTRTLIVLDNAANTAQVQPLLPGGPGCLILVTSRNRLMGLDDAHFFPLDSLTRQEAVTLLGEAAAPRRIDADRDPAVAELAQLCGYTPLAIRIVAARLRHHDSLTPADLIAELRHESSRLDRLRDDERDLTAVFESSFRMLRDPEQRLLCLLGQLPGADIDAYGAASLCGTDARTAERLLESLLDHSLLVQRTPGRYLLHDLLRAYARKRAADAPGGAQARERLLDYYLYTAQVADRLTTRMHRPGEPVAVAAPGPVPALTDSATAHRWLRTECDNVLAALSAEDLSARHRVGLAAAFAAFLKHERASALAAIELHLRAAAAASELGDRVSEANAFWDAARSDDDDRATYTEGGTHLDRALEIYRQAGERQGEANVFIQLGWREYKNGDLAKAAEYQELALGVYQNLGDRLGEASTLRDLGGTKHMQGDYAAAIALQEQARKTADEIGDRLGEGIMIGEIGRAQLITGVYRDAAASLQRAISIFRKLDNRAAEAVGLWELSRVRVAEGDYAAAIELLGRALPVLRAAGYRRVEGYAMWSMGRARLGAGELSSAADCESAALDIFLDVDSRNGRANALADLGRVRRAQGELDEAEELLDQALVEFRGDGGLHGQSEVHCSLAALRLEVSGPQAALPAFQTSLTLAQKIGSPTDTARALVGIARCEELLGERESARERLARAVELFRWAGAAETQQTEALLERFGRGGPGA